MERLTRNVGSTNEPVYACNKSVEDFNGNELIDANQKLGRYEDFEQYLGIDFKTFVKSLVKGIYVKTDEGIINYKNSVGWIWKIGQNDNYVDTERPGEFYFAIIYGHVYYYYLKDYGKTWALTREELEHE